MYGLRQRRLCDSDVHRQTAFIVVAKHLRIEGAISSFEMYFLYIFVHSFSGIAMTRFYKYIANCINRADEVTQFNNNR